MNRGTEEKTVYTPKEVAEYLRISITAAYNLMHAVDFPSFRVGARWKVRADEFDRWVEETKAGKNRNIRMWPW